VKPISKHFCAELSPGVPAGFDGMPPDGLPGAANKGGKE